MNQAKERIRLLVACTLGGLILFSVVNCRLFESGASVSDSRPTGADSPTSSPANSPTSVPEVHPTDAPGQAANDAGEIAFVREGDLWLSGADGSHQKKLISSGQINSFAWSGDGREIVTTEEGTPFFSKVAVVDVVSGKKRTLVEGPGTIADPSWSPDATQIAFSLTNDTNGDQQIDLRDKSEIWLMGGEGRNRRWLTDGYWPSWSPDGRKLAYVSNGDLRQEPPYRAENDIQLVEVEGQTKEAILRVRDVPEDLSKYNYPFKPSTILLQHPAWSPDGYRIGFSTIGHTGLIGVIDVDGRNLRLVGFNYEGGFGRVRWAPTGKRIAAESFPPSGIAHVVISDLANGNTVNIGKEPSGPSVRSPSWSPDALRLLVVRVDGEPYLASVKPDGAGLQLVATGEIADAAWNPARKR